MSQPAEPQFIELAEWARPWLSGILPTRMVEQIPAGSPHPQSQNSSLHPPNDSLSLISSPSFVSTNPDDTAPLTKLPDVRLVVTLGQERTVSRALRGIHLFVCEDLRNSELKRGPSCIIDCNRQRWSYLVPRNLEG